MKQEQKKLPNKQLLLFTKKYKYVLTSVIDTHIIKLGDGYMSIVRKKYNLSHAEIFNIDLLITNCSLFKKIKA